MLNSRSVRVCDAVELSLMVCCPADPVQAESRTRLRATVGSVPTSCEVRGEVVCNTYVVSKRFVCLGAHADGFRVRPVPLIQTINKRPCARFQHLKTTNRLYRTSSCRLFSIPCTPSCSLTSSRPQNRRRNSSTLDARALCNASKGPKQGLAHDTSGQ